MIKRRSIQGQEGENASLIGTLAVIADPVAVELAERMERCRDHRHQRRARPRSLVEAVKAGPQFKCKTVACWACRKAHVGRKQEEAGALFDYAVNADCSLITVNAAKPVGSLDEVSELHRLFKATLNNWRDAAARDDRRYERMAAYAVLEVQHDGSLWRPHWHIVAHHPRIDRQEIAERTRDQWPGARRVQVKAFHADKTVADNVKPSFGRKQFADVQTMLANGVSVSQVAKENGLTRQTVYRIQSDAAACEAALASWGQ